MVPIEAAPRILPKTSRCPRMSYPHTVEPTIHTLINVIIACAPSYYCTASIGELWAGVFLCGRNTESLAVAGNWRPIALLHRPEPWGLGVLRSACSRPGPSSDSSLAQLISTIAMTGNGKPKTQGFLAIRSVGVPIFQLSYLISCSTVQLIYHLIPRCSLSSYSFLIPFTYSLILLPSIGFCPLSFRRPTILSSSVCSLVHATPSS